MSNLAAGDAQLFEDTFTVTEHDSAKYDRVARITATSTDNQTTMSLDINSELLHIRAGVNIEVLLATSLSLDGIKDEEEEKGWRHVRGENTLADMYDYVCYGKIYKFEDGVDGQTIRAYISFGGLLMQIEGPYKKLTPLRVENAYLLIKK